VFDELPKRYTQAGLINDFPAAVSRELLRRFGHDTPEVKVELGPYFTDKDGFGPIRAINEIDGVRIFFMNGDIAHMRTSGNAPQLRIYSVADTQERADEIARLALAEPDGIYRRLQRALESVGA
jgi:phosphomannomutase